MNNIANVEARMTNQVRNPNDECSTGVDRTPSLSFELRHCFVIRASSLLLALCLCASVVPKTLAADQAIRAPNIVIIFCDDLGYADVGCFGAKGWKTPNIDQLAKDGMRLTSFYVSQPVCGASRSSLLTGCYANRVGIHGAPGPHSTTGISNRETTLAELVKSRGYNTAMCGKWHLGHHPKFLPTHHGFDEYYGLPYSNDMHGEPVTESGGRSQPLPLFRDETVIESEPDQKLLTERYTTEAIGFLRDCTAAAAWRRCNRG